MVEYCGLSRRSFFLVGFIYLSLVPATFSQDHDPQCTNFRTGLPATNFDKGFNTWKGSDKADDAWIYSENDSPISRKYGVGGYIYLDDSKSNEKPSRIEAQFESQTAAVCIDFFHATTGPSNEPIRFYLWDGKQDFLMHEDFPTQEVGTWNSTTFACCLPKELTGNVKFMIEATSHKNAIVAIDYIDVRHSNMSCGSNSQLVCYPAPPTVEPPVKTTLPGETIWPPQTDIPGHSYEPTCSGEREVGMPSCDFSLAEATLENCQWANIRRDDWVFDTENGQRYIYTLESANEVLQSYIADDLLAACVEIMFAPGNETEDISDLFKIYLSNETVTVLWGASYDYTNDSNTEWKVNSFDGCIGSGPHRRLSIVASNAGLKVKYILVRKSLNPGAVCRDDSTVAPTVQPSTTSGGAPKDNPEPPTDIPSDQTPASTDQPEGETGSADSGSNTGSKSIAGSSNVAGIVGGILTALAIVGLILAGLWWWNKRRNADNGGRYVYNTATGVESIATAIAGVQNSAYTP